MKALALSETKPSKMNKRDALKHAISLEVSHHLGLKGYSAHRLSAKPLL